MARNIPFTLKLHQNGRKSHFFKVAFSLYMAMLKAQGDKRWRGRVSSSLSNMRVQQEVIQQQTSFGGNVAFSPNGILWINPEMNIMNTLGPRGLGMYSLLSTPKSIWAQWCYFECCEAWWPCSYCLNIDFFHHYSCIRSSKVVVYSWMMCVQRTPITWIL